MAIEVESNVLEAEFEVVGGNKQKALAEYGTLVSDAVLAEYRERFSGLSAQTKEGYEDVRKAIAVCRTTRTGVEKKRKELNKDAQGWINAVNSEAARLTSEIESIEDPLKVMKQAVDDQRERLRAEAEAARVKKINDRLTAFITLTGSACSLENAQKWSDEQFAQELADAQAVYQAELEAERIAEEKRQQLEALRQEQIRKQQEEIEQQRAELERQRAEQEAQLQRIRAEQEEARIKHEAELQRIREEQAERDRIEQEARKAELEQYWRQKAEEDRIERERLEAERAELQAQRERLQREEALRQEKIWQEQEALRLAEEERLAAERAEKERIEEELRREALKPDLQKVDAFRAAMLQAIESVLVPDVQCESIRLHFEWQVQQLRILASAIPHID
jgi:DNA repair exonuclease SbcCD ATPase subunit